jgi:cell division septum initiation protein DivIVA
MTTELLPLRTGFDVAWLGYRRDQVQYYVGEAERDFALLAADRDAAEARAVSLARNLEAAREENRVLRDRIDRLCRQPLSPEAVGERLRHAVDAALTEAAAIVERAGAIEGHVWASAQQTHAEHRDLLATTRERMTRLVREGEARRLALDEAAAKQRAQVQEDFELALALRRKESLRDAQLIEETARLRADRMLREAARQVEVLREHRDRVADVLRVVHSLLGKAAGHLRVGESVR